MTRWQKGLEGRGWNSNYLNNHDQARQVSRFGDDGTYRVESAKMLGTFLHLLQGTPYIYQGEEIGMTNVAFESIDDYDDVEIHNFYREHVIEGSCSADEAMRMIRARGRDNARTPVQWSAEPNAGFTTGTPWLKVNPNYPEINVEQALADPNSVFYYYQKLIQLRKSVPAIVYGTYDLLLPDHEQIYAFTRTLQDQRLLVILNFSAETPLFELPEDIPVSGAELLIGNYAVDPAEDISNFHLKPYEARVYQLN
jgi:oligo-1,6-glucosidase